MPTTQTNGTDTATFERRDDRRLSEMLTADSDAETQATRVFDPDNAGAESQCSPLVAGGQGRTARDVETTVDVLLLLAVVALSGVIVLLIGG